MAKRENFYRRDPGAALAGMAGMSLEERGVYNTVIDLLYLTWRPVEDNPGYIAGHCGCAVQKLNPLLRKLVEKGKLVRFVEGGQSFISNPRFEDERAAYKGPVATRSGRAEVADKSGGVEEKSPGVSENPPGTPDESPENPSVTALDKRREDEIEPPTPKGAKARRSPERPIPDGYPDDGALADGRRFCVDEGVIIDVPYEAKRFRLNAEQNERRCRNWAAAWRNWLVGALPRAPKAATRLDNGPAEMIQHAWMEDWLEFGKPGWRQHERGPYPGEEGCRVDAEIQRRHGVAPFGDPPADLLAFEPGRAVVQ